MSPLRNVAVVFDDQLRPDTTGIHCLRALSTLCTATHLRPSQLSSITKAHFDLFLRIDDGLQIEWPTHLRPCACWLIDTHIDFETRLRTAADFDFVFAAQRNGAMKLHAAGISQATWLPLACDPDLHYSREAPQAWDLGFVGNILPGRRASMISRLSRQFPQSYFGHAYGEDLARVYSASRIAFNCAVADDINMRVFEAMACGAALATNDLKHNGQEELFTDGVHFITYECFDDLVDKVEYYLSRELPRVALARRGQAEVHAHHTYLHRMTHVLTQAQNTRSSVCTSLRTFGDVLDNEVDFCVKSFLRPNALLQLLQSIRTYYPHAPITVVDDGDLSSAIDVNSQECLKLIRSDSRITLRQVEFAAGVSSGRNELVKATNRPFVLFLDDDFVFTDDTKIELLLERLRRDPSVGLDKATSLL